jgi:dTDP-4-amino-4,6-dideoxygalactose transaminase
MSNNGIRQIPFMRLDRQFATHRSEFLAAMLPVLESGAVLQGPQVAAFETKLAAMLGARHAVAVGSGTDAMLLAMFALDLPEGSRVAVPAMTFIASAAPILHARCRPIFVDCDPRTGLADETALLDLIEQRAVDAVIVVHLYGQLQNLDRIAPAARERGIPLIEDSAQALGALRHGVPAGRAGLCAAISFDPMKVIGAFGSGGALITDDDNVARVARQLRYHGDDGKAHYVRPGFNCQMHSLQAAALSVKLDQAQAWQARRHAIASILDDALAGAPGLQRMTTLPGNLHNDHKYVVWVDDRDAMRQALADTGVQTKVHYERPLHRQPLFAAFADGNSCPNADAVSAHALSLPMYPELTDDEVHYIAHAVRHSLGAVYSGG